MEVFKQTFKSFPLNKYLCANISHFRIQNITDQHLFWSHDMREINDPNLEYLLGNDLWSQNNGPIWDYRKNYRHICMRFLFNPHSDFSSLSQFIYFNLAEGHFCVRRATDTSF